MTYLVRKLTTNNMPPIKLYKFVSEANAVEPILSGSIKFAQKDQLNDPSEFVPEVEKRALTKSLEYLRQCGHSAEQFEWLCAQGFLMRKLCPEYQVIPVPRSIKEADSIIKSSFYNDFSKLSEILFGMANTIAERTGIQCLSERWSCLPMWAHYAANGRGCVIEYERIHEFFAGDDTRLLNGVYRVDYSEEQRGVTFDPVSYNSLFYSKFSDWSYEREWRIVSSISDCEKASFGTSQINIRRIPPKHIAGIIVGWSMDKKTTEFVLKASAGKVPVYRASFSQSGLQKTLIS